MPPSPPSDGPPLPTPTSTTHATTTLPLHADVAAFCTHPSAPNLLAAGGYQLDEATATRSGLLQLFDTRGRSLRVAGPAWSGAGVLDAAWQPEASSSPHLALALADGKLALLEVVSADGCVACEGWLEAEEEEAAELTLRPARAPLPVATGGPLALAAAWSRDGTMLAASTSAGTLAVARYTPTGLVLEVEPWEAHSLEAWCVAWGGGDGGASSSLLLSGADDAALKGWDTRESSASPSLTFTDARTHAAGVTTIAPHPSRPHLLATGSYDEQARLWDTRAPGRPLLTSTLPTGGGAWRLRWHPADPTLLLLAGMHAGFSILKVKESENGPELAVEERYPHQATLAYGADWCAAPPPPSRPGASLVATASFYDNLVHLWEPGTRAVW